MPWGKGNPSFFFRCKVLIACIQTAGLGTGIRSSKTMQATVAVTKYNCNRDFTLKRRGSGILVICCIERFHFTCKTNTVPLPTSFLLERKPTLPAALFAPAVKPWSCTYEVTISCDGNVTHWCDVIIQPYDSGGNGKRSRWAMKCITLV